jgi:hypothetical protein
MTTTATPASGPGEDERRDALADRLLTSVIESMELASVWLGLPLGLYEIERLNYAFSWWHCLPASRAGTPSAAAGTALRPGTVRRWADQAGFASLRELPVDHLFWRFYELRG